MLITDTSIMRGIEQYRASVEHRYGPISLASLARFLKESGLVEKQPSKQALSYRINRLVNLGMLETTRTETGRMFIPGLFVTERGTKFLEEGKSTRAAGGSGRGRSSKERPVQERN